MYLINFGLLNLVNIIQKFVHLGSQNYLYINYDFKRPFSLYRVVKH